MKLCNLHSKILVRICASVVVCIAILLSLINNRDRVNEPKVHTTVLQKVAGIADDPDHAPSTQLIPGYNIGRHHFTTRPAHYGKSLFRGSAVNPLIYPSLSLTNAISLARCGYSSLFPRPGYYLFLFRYALF